MCFFSVVVGASIFVESLFLFVETRFIVSFCLSGAVHQYTACVLELCLTISSSEVEVYLLITYQCIIVCDIKVCDDVLYEMQYFLRRGPVYWSLSL